jgi:phosphate starvation-inducible PhoH-like protein
LSRAAVILDEAQNATIAQMKMFLTRLGEGAVMAVTGDPTQCDLPSGEPSGLADAVQLLEDAPGVAVVRFTSVDVVRHPLVSRIIDAYDQRDRKARPSRAK